MPLLLLHAQELESACSYHIHLRGRKLDPHCPGIWACSHYPSLMVKFLLEQHPRASPVKDSLGIGAWGSSSAPKGLAPDSLDVDATSGRCHAPLSWLENTGEPPEGPSGTARDEQPGIDPAGHGSIPTVAPQMKCFHVLLHSRLPHRTRASCRFHRGALISAPDDQKKPKGNMSRGSDSRCFRALLVARKNISLVSPWALQVSISGALLFAREHKTANVREKNRKKK